MNGLVFDTLKFVKRLKEAGFTEPQAEALAAAAELIEGNLARKRDIEELRRDTKALETSLRRDIEELRTELKWDMKDLEYRMTIKFGTLMIVVVSVVVALVKLL